METTTEVVQTPVVKQKPVREKPKKVPLSHSKTIILKNSNGESLELNPNDNLPDSFLESKLRENQLYIPIGTYREIMRQLDEFWVPRFWDLEKVLVWKTKTWTDAIAYKMKVEVEWNRPWQKTPTVLVWTWYSSMTAWILLSDAIHWNIKTIEAKALRDALKHSYRIFEFPEKETSSDIKPEDVAWIEKSTPQKVVDEVVKESTESIDKIKEEMKKVYTEKYNEIVNAVKEFGKNPTKKQVLAIWTALKEQFWDKFKPYISELLTNDYNTSDDE